MNAEARPQHLSSGSPRSIVVCTPALLYLLATWDHPHRAFSIAAVALGAAGTAVIGLADAERIVRSRWREAFFLSWSLMDIGLVAVLVAADGGARSPIVTPTPSSTGPRTMMPAARTT